MVGKFSAAGSGRNYGYGRSLSYAGHQALQEYYGGGHFSSVATHASRFGQFVKWARKEEGVRDIARNDAQQLLERYADNVGQKAEDNVISKAYAQNLISSAQVVLRAVTGDETINVKPSEHCGPRSNVRTQAPESLSRATVERAVGTMREAGLQRAAAVTELAREFGLREREASLADLGRLEREAREHGVVNVQEGTKGGRDADRLVPVSDGGRAALDAAIAARPEGSRNLLSPGESYRRFVDSELRDGRAPLKAAGIPGYHDCRAAYACDRYEQLTGHQAPAVSGCRTAARDVDMQARQAITHELGHGRIDVVVSYIGGQK